MTGSGTSSDPYQISSAEDLKEFRDKVKQDSGTCAVLMNDIVLNADVTTDNAIELDTNNKLSTEYLPNFNGIKWTNGIGDTAGYSGEFDGNGHMISGLVYYTKSSSVYGGLFSTITSGGKVVNLKLCNSIIYIDYKNDNACGGIAGANAGTIENCYVQAYIAGKTHVGGISGKNTGIINRCSAMGKVESKRSEASIYSGGIAGMNSGTITDCYTTNITIAGQDANVVGGIAGFNKGNIKNCINLGSFKSGTIGQLVGNAPKGGTLTNCYYNSKQNWWGKGGNNTLINCEYKSDKSFGSGEVTYLLNNGVTDGTQAWYQRIDTDAYPTLDSGNKASGTVYSSAVKYCDGTTASEGGYSNTASGSSVVQHKTLVAQAEVPATCSKTGTKACYYCESCKKYYSDANGSKQISAPETIAKMAHTLTAIAKKEATCTADGYEAYWKCSVCGAMFADSLGTNSINAVPVIKASGSHQYTVTKPFTWTKSSDGLTYTKATATLTCSKCNYSEVKTCTLSDPVVNNATCTEDGSKIYTAKVSYNNTEDSDTITLTIPKSGHTLEHILKQEATCTTDGYEEYWKCTTCGKIYADQSATTLLETKKIISKLGHDLGQNKPVFSWQLSDDGKTYHSAYAVFTCSRCTETSGNVPCNINVTDDGKASCTVEGTVTYTATISYQDGSTYTDSKTIKKKLEHESDGTIKDNQDGTHSYHCKNCNQDIAAENHSGGAANCKELAVCTVCGAKYGSLGNHVLTKELAKEPTCEKAGYQAYWKCGICDKLFADEAGSKEITQPIAIAALGHDYGASAPTFQWVKNATGTGYDKVIAIFTCSRDKATKSIDCVPDLTNESVASCENDGTKFYKVSVTVGGNTYTAENHIVVSKLGHSLRYFEKVEPTCETSGKAAYYMCTTCNKKFEDSQAQKEIQTVPDLEKLGHDWKNPEFTWSKAADGVNYEAVVVYTCSRCDKTSNKMTCTVASKVNKASTCTEEGEVVYTATAPNGDSNTYTVREKKPHTYEQKPSANVDGKTHSLHCKECETDIECEAHYGGTATCEKKAICNACGAEYGELGSHKLVRVEAKMATCTEDGQEEYWKCSECGKFFDDKDAVTPIDSPKIIKATGHSYGEPLRFEWTKAEDGISYSKVMAVFCCERDSVLLSEQCTIELSNETPATCIKKGERVYTARVQLSGSQAYEDSKTVELPLAAHTPDDQVIDNGDGKTHSLHCSVCDQDIKGEEHYGGKATCVKKAVCEACGAEYGDLVGHSLEMIDGKEPTATEDGYKSYWKCSECGTLFADAEGTQSIEKPEVIPATGQKKDDPEEDTKDQTNQGNTSATTETPTTQTPTTEAPKQETVAGNTASEGNMIEDKQVTYTVTDAANQEVQYTSSQVQGKKAVVPDTVTLNGIVYKVTSVSDKAFANNKKIKEIAIGKNVTTIGKNAFAGCKNLKRIVIKSMDIKKIGKKAFKGIHKKATIKVPKKQYKQYKKLLKKAGFKNLNRIKK